MSANVGLSTPRGSGTSGYVQKSQAFLRPREPLDQRREHATTASEAQRSTPQDPKIAEHEQQRKIEVLVMEERERLEEESDQKEANGEKGWNDEEIEDKCSSYRMDLLAQHTRGKERSRGFPRAGLDKRPPGGGWQRPEPNIADRRDGGGFGYERSSYRDWDRPASRS